jgi:hypothetical protein
MISRSALAVTAAVSVVTLTACAADTEHASDQDVPQVEEGTIETSACPIRYGCNEPVYTPPLVVDPGYPDFYCKGTGPHGGTLMLKDGKCVEEIIVMNPCGGWYFTCPPSRYYSAYNPCPSYKPYYRCNVYGDCWCSSYP